MSKCRKLLRADLESLSCRDMAVYLLGKLLVRRLESGKILKGRIVETECYLGGEDKASSTYNGRKSAENEPLYMSTGTAYVYFTYGMYFCMNISAQEPGAGVLLRALEPVEGTELMKLYRAAQNKGNLKMTDLCNGPAKLCMAMNISKVNCNKTDLTKSESLWLEDDGQVLENSHLVTSTRIGINRAAEEWAQQPFRFYILSNLHVSKRDQKAEEMLM